jgi:hypothetical protein
LDFLAIDPTLRALIFGVFFLFSLAVTLWVFYEYEGSSLAREVLYYVIAAALAAVITLPARATSAFTLDLDAQGRVNPLGNLSFAGAAVALGLTLLYLVRVRHRAPAYEIQTPAAAPAPPPSAPPVDSEATLLGGLPAAAAPSPPPPAPAADATQVAQRPADTAPFMAIRSGPGAGQFVQLLPDCTIGRTADNLVTLADSSVSRRHAGVRLVDGQWTLFDLGSTNGSWLLTGSGRQRLESRHTLAEGDRIEIGTFVLEFTRSPRS